MFIQCNIYIDHLVSLAYVTLLQKLAGDLEALEELYVLVHSLSYSSKIASNVFI